MALDQEMVRADHGTKLFALLGVAGVVTAGIVFALVGSPSRARDSRSDAPVAQVTFGPVGLAAPDRIGVLSKVADSNPATVSRANPLVAVADQSELFPTLPKVPPVYPEKVIAYSAVYEHRTTPSRQVMVWGLAPGGVSAVTRPRRRA